jgi:signal transduction histidine kinase
MRWNWQTWVKSTSARFVALIFLSQLVLTGSVLTFVQRSSQATLTQEQQALVSELRSNLVSDYKVGGEPLLISQIKARLQTVRPSDSVILLTRVNGTIASGNLGAWPTVVSKSTPWQVITLYRKGNPRPETMGVIATPLPGGSNLLTGHVIDGNLRLARVNKKAMIGAFLLAIPLAMLLSLAFGYIIKQRVLTITSTTRAVGSGDLSHRVALDGSGDSFDKLGQGVNAMLERIEALVSELRVVTDGLAHDLRSPITRLTSTLERAMIDTCDTTALAALEKVSVEAGTLLSMLSTALQISRAEAGVGRDRFVETDVSAMLNDLVEIYGPVAEDQDIVISSDAHAGLKVLLHRELISRALSNLIENALKYATGGHHIVMIADRAEDDLILSVADDGPGIPEARRAEALRKFGRLDPARHVSGSGLGLSLVEAVAKLHGGLVVLDDNMPGLRVVMTIKCN